MDLEVAGAFIDDSPSETYSGSRVLGVRLRKFSSWHRLLLNTVNSPFINKGAVTLRDLRIAVGVCRLPAFNSRVRKPWLIPAFICLRALLATVWPKRWRRAKTKEATETPMQRGLKPPVDAFLAYCGGYLQDPPYTIIPPKRINNQAPDTPRGRFDDVIELVGELISWGIEERRAWGMPIGRARVYRILARRNAGSDVDIMTEEEKKFQNDMRKSLKK